MAEAFNIDKFKNNMKINVNKLWDVTWNEEIANNSGKVGNGLTRSRGDADVKITSVDESRAVFTSRATPTERMKALQEEKEEVLFDREHPVKVPVTENGSLIKGEEVTEGTSDNEHTTRSQSNTLEMTSEYNKDTDLLFRSPSHIHPIFKHAFISKCAKLPRWTRYVWVAVAAIAAVAFYAIIVFLILKGLGD